jgi:hypothetical protein
LDLHFPGRGDDAREQIEDVKMDFNVGVGVGGRKRTNMSEIV